MNVLLDSDIIIEILRSRDPLILTQWTDLANSDTHILYSPVSAADVWTGARANEQQLIAHFFKPLTCVPIEYKLGHLSGEFLRQFGKSHNLKIGDALIAATAVQQQAALWTRNRKHYPMKELKFY